MQVNEAEAVIEAFVRSKFDIAPNDPGFSRRSDLYEDGYIDSVGIVELLAFLDTEFDVEVPEAELLSDDFSTIEGIARTICRLKSA
jgi:acyl carrier protein